MALLFTPLAMTSAFDDNGAVMSGAKLHCYLTDTTTPTPTYTTSELSVENANPVIADSSGRFPPIYVPSTVSCKFVLMDADDIIIETIDPFNPQATTERTFPLPLLDGVAASGSPAITAAGLDNIFYGPAFSGTSAEVWATTLLPNWPLDEDGSFGSGVITEITLWFTHDQGASSNSAYFNILIGGDAVVAGPIETAFTVEIGDAADRVEDASMTLAVSVGGGGPLAIHIERLPANANDTFENDIVVIGATFTYAPS
ncbi:MAG TPA: hypothetical protein VF389_11675 [Woeseiaceae bacterium]